MNDKVTNGMDVTLKVLSKLVKQHVGVLISNFLWLSSDVDLTDIGVFYIYKDKTFVGCSRKYRLEIDLSGMLLDYKTSISSDEERVTSAEVVNEDGNGKENDGVPSNEPLRAVSTPNSSKNRVDAAEAFKEYAQQQVLSPIVQNTDKSSDEPLNLSKYQVVFPPREHISYIPSPTSAKKNSGNTDASVDEAVVRRDWEQIPDVNKPSGYEKVEYGCAKCDDRFMSTQGYYTHMFDVHKIRKKIRHPPKMIRTYVKLNEDKDDEQPAVVAEPDDSLECVYCEKQYLTHKLLRIHLDRDHPLFKPSLCANCDRVFFTKDGLYTHKVQDHAQNEPILGQKANTSTKQQIIDVLPPIVEETTGADFNSGELDKHGVFEEPNTEDTTHIESSSGTVQQTSEVVSQEQNTERKSNRLSRRRTRETARAQEAAKEVMKEVIETSIVQDIKKKDTPEKEYICDYCVTGFFHQEGLIMHLINEHKVQPEKKTSKDGSNVVEKTSEKATQGKYKCGYCEKFFHTKVGRTTHERGHEGNYIFEQTKSWECEAKKLGITLEEYMKLNEGEKSKGMKRTIETRSSKKKIDSNNNKEDTHVDNIVQLQPKVTKDENKEATEKKAMNGEGKQLKNPNRVLAFQWAKAAKKATSSKKRRMCRKKSIHFWELYQSEKRKKKLIKEACKSDDEVEEIKVAGQEKKANKPDAGEEQISRKRRRVSFEADSSKDKELTEESMPDINYSEGRRRRKKSGENTSDNDVVSPKKCPKKSESVSNDSNNGEQNTNELNSAPKNRGKSAQNTDAIRRSPRKKYTTKDPRCKFDKDLLKQKTYSLRSSQIKKKSDDGDNSKDLDWEPNASDVSVSLERIDISSLSKTPVVKKSATNTKPVNKASSSASNEQTVKDSNAPQKKGKHTKSVGKECKKCCTQFTTNWEYRIHVSYCGFGSKPITCPAKNCGKVFQQKILFRQHFKYHHTNEPKDFVCGHCDAKPFVYSKTFNTHVSRLHTPNSEKAFMCDTCGKLFAKQWEYSNHRQNSHSVDKPFLCGLCKKSAFPTSARLQQHLK